MRRIDKQTLENSSIPGAPLTSFTDSFAALVEQSVKLSFITNAYWTVFCLRITVTTMNQDRLRYTPPIKMFGLRSHMSAITYTTDYTKDECIRRLQAHTGRSRWSRWAEGTISAKIRGDHFRLFAWGPANVRNSFAPLFYGYFEEDKGKTRIKGHFRMHPIVWAFLVVWFGGLMAMSCLILLLPPSAWGSGQSPSGFVVLGPVGMMLLGFGFVQFGRWLASGQAERLELFLAHELKAQPCHQASPTIAIGCNI